MEKSKYVTKVQNWDRSAEIWSRKSKKDQSLNEKFIPFIFEYIAFNALYSDMTCNGNNDRDKIKCIKKLITENQEIKMDFLNKLNEIYGNFNDKEIRVLNVALKRKSNHWPNYWDINIAGDGIITRGRNIDEKDIPNVIEFVYRVRNNLVHGFKDCNEPRDKILANIAYKFLSTLVEILLKPQNFNKLKIRNLH